MCHCTLHSGCSPTFDANQLACPACSIMIIRCYLVFQHSSQADSNIAVGQQHRPPNNIVFDVQELLYPEFCEALVRIAQMRFAAMPDLEARLRHLVTHHLLPLLQPTCRPHAIVAFMSGREFAQALATIDPVLRITFSAGSTLLVCFPRRTTCALLNVSLQCPYANTATFPCAHVAPQKCSATRFLEGRTGI